MSELLIAAPLRLEALLVRSAAGRARVFRTGMGPRRARAAAQTLLREPGNALLVLGFCGGLDERSVPGEVIVAEEVAAAEDQGRGSERIACADVLGLVGALASSGLPVRSGKIACVSRPALGERRAQLARGGAIAADMESVWLAAGAGARPFGVVRVTLDTPSHKLLRPALAAGLAGAASALRRAAGALHEWAPAD